MRPIKLKMQAFGTYVKPIELDFEKGLRGQKFFLIHGATGSGKTTILDAICYALYSESSGEDKKAENLHSELAPIESKTEVEFTFALGEKIYKIRRNPAQVMPKGTADIKKSATLYIDDKFISSDTKEIDELIKSRMGFNAKQFRQVVMLPQGKFRDFLTATSTKKAEILNVIFNSVLYEKVEEGLKKKSEIVTAEKNILENKRDNIFEQVRDIGKVSGEIDLSAITEKISANFTESKNKLGELKNQAEKAQDNLNIGIALNTKFEQFEIAEKNLISAKNELAKISAEFEKAEVEYKKRKSEENLRKELENKINDLKKIQSDIVELQNKKSELNQAETAEKNSREEIKKFEERQQKYNSRLENLKAEIEKLQGADVKLKIAEQNLEKSADKQNNLNELERLKKEKINSKKRLEIAEKNYNDAQKEVDRLKLLQKMCTAAKLAMDLAEGEPCPVCGAIHHPHLAITEEIIPTDEEIESKDKFLKKKDIERNSAIRAVDNIEDKINWHNEQIKKFAEVQDYNDVKKIYDEAKKNADILAEDNKNLRKGENFIKQNDADLKNAQKIYQETSAKAANLNGIIETIQKQIPKEYSADVQKITADLFENQKLKNNLDDAWKKADDDFNKLNMQKSKLEGKVNSAENAKNSASEKISGQIKPNLIELKKISDEKQNIYINQNTQVNNLKQDLNKLNELAKKLDELEKKISESEKNYQIWTRLYEVASGKNSARMTFQNYYLNAMFQDVIREANERLEKMSGGRYQFQDMEGFKKHARKAGLDLEILDAYTGKARPVETLSGGESFLASLSLALGLAAVVKNTAGGIKLDTIFIDEGFGSLDSETLDFAINALTDLQKDGGRLVGIISHVEELKNRIPARLEVIKSKVGSTAKFI